MPGPFKPKNQDQPKQIDYLAVCNEIIFWGGLKKKLHEPLCYLIADLNNIQKQTKAMGKLNTSQMNVRSLSLSETGAMIYCSSIDISESGNGNESTIPIMAQPTSPASLVFNERLVYSPFLQITKFKKYRNY